MFPLVIHRDRSMISLDKLHTRFMVHADLRNSNHTATINSVIHMSAKKEIKGMLLSAVSVQAGASLFYVR